jgi:hypothetical protein
VASDHIDRARRRARAQQEAERNGTPGRGAASPLTERLRRDSQKPPLEEYPGDPEPWPPPIPLGTTPAVEPFPLDVLPQQLAAFVQDAAAAISCPADYIAVPMLVLAGAAVGTSRALEIKPGYTERACLYAAVVGPPGAAKTPALKLAAGPVYQEQARRMLAYQQQRERYDEQDGDRRGRPPKPSTAYVSDITTEKLAEVLQDNPRGVALIRDELSAWVGAMDQYRAHGRGADRQFYLSAWGGEPVSVHRKNQQAGPLFVAHPFISVVGGIQPDLLANLRGERRAADGFLDRLLFAYPAPPQAVGETWACVSDDAARAWGETLRLLYSLEAETTADGTTRPHFVKLTGDGRTTWEKFTGRLAAEMNAADFPDVLRGPWSKMRAHGARLALIVHYLRMAGDELTCDEVDGESLQCAARLASYFQSHARKVYHTLGADKKVGDAQKVWAWIVRERRTEFRRWEAHKDLQSDGRFPTLEALDAPLAFLEQHHLIRQQQRPERRGSGRQPAPVYEVNPLALAAASGESGESGKSGK